MSALKRIARTAVVGGVRLVYGDEFKAHRIPFGPLRGRRIYMRATHSVRMLFGFDETRLVKTLAELVKPGDIVYDIGAHVGYTSLMLADLVGPQGQVHAFEVLPSTAALLRKTIELNGYSQVDVHEFGLGKEHAQLQLISNARGMGFIYHTPDPDAHKENCTVVPLDEYARDNNLPAPRLVKMDIEQAEVDALRGGEQFLREHRPTLLVEFHTLNLLREGLHLLQDWGYSLRTLDGQPVDEARLAALDRFHESVLCAPA